MLDDLFDDEGLRRVLGAALGMRALRLGGTDERAVWAFERKRYGLRQLELGPLGLYCAVADAPAEVDGLVALADRAQRSASRVRINVNPLDRRGGEIARRTARCGFTTESNETHLLPLRGSIDDLRAGYHATKRHQVQRRARLASTIVQADCATQLDDYAEVYGASIVRWGLDGPTYPRSLFDALLACPSVRIWMNYVEGRLACAMIVLRCRRYALYWQGVSRNDDGQKAAYPMVRLMDTVLQDLLAAGIPYLNLGASDGLPTVRRFKEEFGARPASYPALVYESPLWRALRGARAALFRTSRRPSLPSVGQR